MNRTLLTVVALSTVVGVSSARAQSRDDYYMATGNTCSSVDVSAASKVQIKADGYNSSTMISADSAKLLALCAVPGQVTSGELETDKNGMAHYAITIIPNKKKTHAKVIVDAQTGAVLSSKQFGGLRGVTGWVRESAEHKKNAKQQ